MNILFKVACHVRCHWKKDGILHIKSFHPMAVEHALPISQAPVHERCEHHISSTNSFNASGIDIQLVIIKETSRTFLDLKPWSSQVRAKLGQTFACHSSLEG